MEYTISAYILSAICMKNIRKQHLKIQFTQKIRSRMIIFDQIIINMFLKSIIRGAPLAIAALSSRFFCAQQEKKYQTYLWGNGVYQARPDALLQFQNFTPKKITNLPQNIVQLQFGQYYQAGIDSKGQLYVWNSQQMDANLQVGDKKATQRRNIQKLAKDIRQVKFTTGYIWTLTTKSEVIQYPIIKQFSQGKQVSKVTLGKPRTVDPLKGSRQICAGRYCFIYLGDHLISLSEKGEVWAMGDDTFGQCANDAQLRVTFPPFAEKRVTYPIKIPYLKNIRKITAGGYHCLALDQSGTLYGWGSNSNLQLSHQQEFSQMNTPLICSFKPIKISKGLDNNEIIDMKAGEEFSVIVSKNKVSNSYQVHTFGSNLKGQLGIGEIRHVRDITKVQALSNFILKRQGKQQKVEVKQLSCGNKHCIALLNIGYIMEWGDNEHGQMGNKKRSTAYSPIIVRDFSQKDIIGVFAGYNASGVIIREQQTKQTNKSK